MQYQESKSVELKVQVNKHFKKEILAFANSQGGTIYVGVSDTGEVVGVHNPQETAEAISNMIRDGISPDLTTATEVSIIQDNGKSLISVEVQSASRKPYHLTKEGMKPSGVYVRHNTSSVQASWDTIRQLIQEADGIIFDKTRSLQQDLTFDYATSYFKKQQLNFSQVEQRSLKLRNDKGYFTNAALLLSDQCGLIIKCAVAGNDDSEIFHARKEFDGSILKQLDDTLDYLNMANHIKGTLVGAHRVDSQSYPPIAIREALCNAIVHRDYDISSPIIINIYPDFMEFISVGGLGKGLTLQDVSCGVSYARNQIIADVFFRLRLIESYGTGIRHILRSYEDFHNQPEFLANPKSFVVKLPNRNGK